MLGSQIIDNGYHLSEKMVGNIPNLESPHSYKGVVRRFLGKELRSDKKTMQKSFIDFSGEFSEEQLEYMKEDVEYLPEIYKEQQKYIQNRNLQKIVALENKLIPVLVKVESKGCLIDKSAHKENIKNWKIKLNEIENKLDNEVINLAKDYPLLQGGKFTNPRRKQAVLQLDMFGGGGYLIENLNVYNVNYSSSKQLGDLFTRIGCEKPVDDDGKVSFGENSIKSYVTNFPESPMIKFVEYLLEYREYDKLLGTYGEKLFQVSDSTGRLRTSYGQCFTDSGRLTSSEIIKGELGVNLANIPKRKDVRRIFVPDEGYSFVDCDMTGQEVMIAGDFSKEPVILKAFKEGFDHHSFLASISYSIIFNKKIEIKNEDIEIEIDGFRYNMKKELREVHKSCLFAKFYGGGAKRVQNVLNKYLVNHWPSSRRVEKADEISKALNAALPTLIKFLRAKVSECQRNGFVVANKLGRRRYFDDVDKAYGEIMNFPIQGTGADSIKIALIKLDKWLTTKSKELGISEDELGWITFSVYDQNILCLNDKYLHLASDIPKIMGESISYFLEDLKGSSDMQIKKQWSK